MRDAFARMAEKMMRSAAAAAVVVTLVARGA